MLLAVPNPLPPVQFRGPISTFGGPMDRGIKRTEGLGFLEEVHTNMVDPYGRPLFLPEGKRPDKEGIADWLDNLRAYYVACRWNYRVTSKLWLRTHIVWVRNVRTGLVLAAQPADWGPHVDTGKVIDQSDALAAALKVQTWGVCEVLFHLPK